MSIKRNLRWVMLASAASAWAFSVSAHAEQASPAPNGATPQTADTAVQAVVVTARRRAEALQDAPVTVTVISGKYLSDQGVSNIRDIINLVPNAVIQDSPNNLNTFINIRGMQEVNTQSEPNVGLYRNGLYAGGERENLGAQVDIDQVEVLSGPQGGYYGRSSVGGTVDIIDAMPTHQFGGYLDGSYGSYDRADIQGAVNLPVSDALALRVAGWSFKQTEAEMKNDTLDQYVGAFDDRGARITADVRPVHQLDIKLLAEYEAYSGPALTAFAPGGVSGNGLTFQPTLPTTYNTVYWNTPSVSTRTNAYFSEKTAYQSDIGEFDLNASYREYGFNSTYDLDQTNLGPPYNIAGASSEHDDVHDTFVEGLYLSKPNQAFTWMVGASYFKEVFGYQVHEGLTFDVDALTGLPLGLGVQTVPVGDPGPGTSITTSSESVFFTAAYEFDPHWSISGGVRYNSDQKSLALLSGIEPISNALLAYIAGAALGPSFPTYDLNLNKTFTFTAPSLTLKYKLSKTVNFYGTYSTGFRPGSFNLTPTSAATVPYNEETAQNFEIGAKATLFSGRLALDAAAFYMPQSNVLITESTPLSQSYYANVGTSITKGVEFTARFRATSWLDGGLSIGLLDPRFNKATVDAGTSEAFSLNNKLLPYTRQGTVNAVANIDEPINDTIHFIASSAIRGEWGGVLGDYVGVLAPYKPLTKVDLLGGVLLNGKTRITVGVKNLLDQHVPQFLFYNGAETATEGRTFSVDISQKF